MTSCDCAIRLVENTPEPTAAATTTEASAPAGVTAATADDDDDDVGITGQDAEAPVMVPNNLQLQGIDDIEQTLRQIIDVYLNADFTIVRRFLVERQT